MNILSQIIYFMIIKPIFNLDPDKEDWRYVILFLRWSNRAHVSASVLMM